MKQATLIPPEAVRFPSRGWWTRLAPVSAAVGVVGLGLTWGLGGADQSRLLHSYLVAFAFFASIALGGLFFVLLQHLTRAGWSVVVRRLAENVAATLPLFALLFIPIALGIHDLYHWSHAEAVAHDPILQHKAPYLSSGRFLARAVVYFVLWSAMSWWYRSRSTAQDESGEVGITRRLQTFSALGMIVYGVTQTFAAFDWIMSLDPHWFSTIFGVYYFAGSAVAIFALLILLGIALERQGALVGLLSSEHFHDLGKLLFAFTVFWAYIAFSQFMLIWYANIPEETIFFAERWEHGWEVVSVALAVGHFVIPFFFLLPRSVKRNRLTLALGALWLLAMHYLDLFWLVIPSHSPEGPSFGALDLTSLLGIGGLFVAVLTWLLRGQPLVPVGDPRLAESLSFENP